MDPNFKSSGCFVVAAALMGGLLVASSLTSPRSSDDTPGTPWIGSSALTGSDPEPLNCQTVWVDANTVCSKGAIACPTGSGCELAACRLNCSGLTVLVPGEGVPIFAEANTRIFNCGNLTDYHAGLTYPSYLCPIGCNCALGLFVSNFYCNSATFIGIRSCDGDGTGPAHN